MSWQPIETAPKDGTMLLLFGPAAKKRRYNLNSGCDVFVGRFNKHYDCWLSVPGEWPRAPTHFQPLPPPPDKTP